MKIKKYILQWCLLLGALSVQSQITNKEQVSILEGTQVSMEEDFNNTPSGIFVNDGELFVYQDFNNDGLLFYSTGATTGLTRFEGQNIQQIKGNQLSEFYDIVFDNSTSPMAFELHGSMSIANEAEFNKGIVENDDYGGTILFEEFAFHSNTSDESHVDSTVKKRGDTDFEFPIGESQKYRRSGISFLKNKKGKEGKSVNQFSFQYELKNSDTADHPHKLADGVIGMIDAAEYWVFTREEGTDEAFITLSWDISTTPAALLAEPRSVLHVVRWDEAKGYWVDEGGVVDEANQTVTTLAELSSEGIYTLARAKEELILPGGLVVYNAVSVDENNQNDFFLIKGIATYPDNSLKIVNRWGVPVYETTGYNETDNVFRGYSGGRATVNKNEKLPVGTYFYILKYEYNNGVSMEVNKKVGYLYINESEK